MHAAHQQISFHPERRAVTVVAQIACAHPGAPYNVALSDGGGHDG